VNPVHAVASVLRNLFNFSGRARRPEFWWFFLIVVVVGFVFLNQFLGRISPFSLSYFDPVDFAISIIQSLLGLAVILPVVYLVVMPAVAARRLHDTGRSARWLLIPCVVILGWAIIVGIATLDGSPFFDDGWGVVIAAVVFGVIWALIGLVGMVALTIVLAVPGAVGPNRYGPDPLRPELGSDWIVQPAPASGATPDASGVSATGHDVSEADSLLESGPANRQFCTQCGTQLQAGAQFCTLCGTAA
jgi:uncharacterized membrane protein YhaH (DUF805 family)